MPGAGVVLVPDAPRRENALLYKRVVADEEGRYSFRGVAPGGYKVFAWSELPMGQAEESPRFLGRYEIYGQGVSVNAPSHLLDVRLIE